jgi:hypothetical protein
MVEGVRKRVMGYPLGFVARFNVASDSNNFVIISKCGSHTNYRKTQIENT